MKEKLLLNNNMTIELNAYVLLTTSDNITVFHIRYSILEYWEMLHFFRNRVFAIFLAEIAPPCCVFYKLKHGGMIFRIKTLHATWGYNF